ncbi:YfdQ family protein [Actinotalea sp. M2MS4P-6]|uniref:YfdQ family protein n=1 Tax=Actinotalea sp. M2MS4P-6 TaxID=2983762 RepID=UPI0021E40B23|nr:YfdQ family protein [Actinotalea sp. M2MS4P-6]MCV2395951.1 YfdQ family protein [Actinotalea sp. M2MS4P-6]
MSAEDTMTTDTQDAINAGVKIAEPKPLEEHNRFYALTPADGSAPVIVDLLDKAQHLAETPLRKTGLVILHTATSLVAYINRHHTEGTEVWADVERSAIRAVINGNATNTPGHGDHIATLMLRKTPSWLAWEKASGQMGSQVRLAELIEDRAIDIVKPASADLLEVAQTFKAARSVDFESSQRLSTGEVAIVYREQVDAKAGRKGELTIPETFELALVPYEGSPTYKVTARLRYRIAEGQLSIGFVLDRPEDVLRAAFDDIAVEVESGIDEGTPVLTGWPGA